MVLCSDARVDGAGYAGTDAKQPVPTSRSDEEKEEAHVKIVQMGTPAKNRLPNIHEDRY